MSLILGCCLVAAAPARGDYFQAAGYQRLVDALAGDVPDGASVTVSQIEAGVGEADDYMPDTQVSQFAGKTFNPLSGSSAVSSHATAVGRFLYGLDDSFAPGIATIDNYEAGNFLGSDFLKTGTTSAPAVESRDVQNHSWIGGFDLQADSLDATRRFDFAIERDDFVAAVGLNNGSGKDQPDLLAHAYNAIAVGRSDGNHSRGTTRFDGAGRVKPDLVAPLGTTSYATALVGSSAGLLLDAADRLALPDAAHSELVKAIMLAGATKAEFATWDRTPTRPLDEVYGAGELNVFRNHQILAAGQHDADPAAPVSPIGWDFGATAADEALYFFDIPDGAMTAELSVALTWNRIVEDGSPGPRNWSNPTSSLANLDLELWSAEAFTLDTMLDQSISTVDNVEHLYVGDGLAAGSYAIRVRSDTVGQEFGLAWFSGPISASPLPPAGDLDGDGVVDAADVNLLFDSFADPAPDPRFDLDGDGDTDAIDAELFITDVLGTFFGDADLNGLVDVVDLGRVGLNFDQSVEGWADGDFNGDRLVDVVDLGQLGLNFTAGNHDAADAPIASDADLRAVPEPGAALLLAFGGLGLVTRSRRRPRGA